jgi:hypothetical protein
MRVPVLRLLIGPALLGLVATNASAQVMEPSASPFSKDPGMEGSAPPVTSYPLGESEAVARVMLSTLRMEQKKRDLCWELGCVVFVNESKTYMVSGFYVQTAAADGKLEWSRNQFLIPLLAKRATFRFKTGGPDACDLPARFVLRAPHSKETVSYDTRVSLCSSPHHDSLVRIHVVIPEVEVGAP